MSEPVWITQTVAFALHRQLIARFGGLDGIRNQGLLESALSRPQQAHASSQPDVFDLAALYAEGIVKNHPFLDGNKRTGFMAAYTFLAANGHFLTAPEEEAVLHTLALAASAEEAGDYAAWLRANTAKKPSPRKRKS